MEAVLFDGGLKFRYDHPVPRPGEGEALIRTSLAGICNTDLEIVRGYAGFHGVIGHEFVGVVREVCGEGGEWIGRRVVGDINCVCGTCGFCLKGMKTHCSERTVLGILGRDGAMAEYVVLPTGNLYEVPEGVSDEEAVFTEPLAAALQILEQVHIRPSERVLVLGDGKLGLLICLVLALSSRQVTLAGRNDEKMRIAAGRGVRTLNAGAGVPLREYDIVVEATGSEAGFEQAMGAVRPRGRIVLKSTVAAGRVMNLAPLVIDEITVIGSRCGPFGPALDLLRDKRVDVKPLISGLFGFDRAEEAFRMAAEKGSLKVLLDFRLPGRTGIFSGKP